MGMAVLGAGLATLVSSAYRIFWFRASLGMGTPFATFEKMLHAGSLIGQTGGSTSGRLVLIISSSSQPSHPSTRRRRAPTV